MSRGVELAVRTDLGVLADADVGAVQHNGVVIDEDVFIQQDAGAVVAMEGWTDHRTLRNAGYQFFECGTIIFIVHGHRAEAGA